MNDVINPNQPLGGAESVGKYTAKTFMWMFLGLLTTFLISFGGYMTGLVFYVFAVPYAYLILGGAELIVVVVLSARINKLSVGAARGLFFAYAVLNGIVFSAYFLLFEMPSLIFVFAITAAYFGIMAAVGYFTKVDLSGLRPFLMCGLLFLVAFWFLSMFMNLGSMERIVSFIGVAIFLAFTAYDTQKIKAYHAAYSGDTAMLQKASIFSALQLYLDFINLFLYLLRFFGKRSN